MTTASVVAVRDVIAAILRDQHMVMDSERVRDLLAAEAGWQLTTERVFAHCLALHVDGKVQRFRPETGSGWRTRWMWIEPGLVPGRRAEADVAVEFAALAQLAGDPGPTR